MPQAHKDLYAYCNAVMEPWDGPAAICGFGGRWAIAGMDRNGLQAAALHHHQRRPAVRRLGDRHGALDEARIVEKGRVGPGQMIAVDLHEGRLYHDRELKNHLAGERPSASGTVQHHGDRRPDQAGSRRAAGVRAEELRRRQLRRA